MEFRFICGYDKNPMELTLRKFNYNYRCSMKRFDNEDGHCVVCNNVIPLNTYKQLMDELNFIKDEELIKLGHNDIIEDVQYEITDITEDLITISVKYMKRKTKNNKIKKHKKGKRSDSSENNI